MLILLLCCNNNNNNYYCNIILSSFFFSPSTTTTTNSFFLLHRLCTMCGSRLLCQTPANSTFSERIRNRLRVSFIAERKIESHFRPRSAPSNR